MGQPFARWPNGNGYTPRNGLIERSFFTRDGLWCTVDLRQVPADQTYFRGLMPEANFSLSAPSTGHPRAFDIGKCNGQPDGHFEMFDADVMLPNSQPTRRPFSCAISRPRILQLCMSGRPAALVHLRTFHGLRRACTSPLISFLQQALRLRCGGSSRQCITRCTMGLQRCASG